MRTPKKVITQFKNDKARKQHYNQMCEEINNPIKWCQMEVQLALYDREMGYDKLSEKERNYE